MPGRRLDEAGDAKSVLVWVAIVCGNKDKKIILRSEEPCYG